jgi:hypothetical protein
VTTQDKKEFLNFIEQRQLTMIFEHDPLFYGSSVKKNEKGDFVCDKKFDYTPKSAYSIF